MSAQEWLVIAGLAGSVLLGTALQRITGVGFALVAAPFLVAVLGPFNGILVVNLFGTVTSLIVFFRVFRQVEYVRVMWLLAAALLALLPGAWVAKNVRSDILSVIIGSLILIALCTSFLVRRSSRFGGRTGILVAGFASGFMNITAGVGGPAVTAYAVASKWPQQAFAASLQLYFFVLGGASLLAKQSLPILDLPQWVGCAVALAIGIVAGELIGKRVSVVAVRRLVIALAFIGALLVLAKGLFEWAGS